MSVIEKLQIVHVQILHILDQSLMGKLHAVPEILKVLIEWGEVYTSTDLWTKS